jgi:hypothetical protein
MTPGLCFARALGNTSAAAAATHATRIPMLKLYGMLMAWETGGENHWPIGLVLHTVNPVVDDCFGHPRLAAIYDSLDPDRSDLDAYLEMVDAFEARRVLDIGCGTGVFALLLADREIEVVGVDPARASIDVARAKPGSGRVRWICGDATTSRRCGLTLPR